MSIDDLYNNFNIVEQEVKRSVSSGSNSRSQNMAFVSTPGSTNEDTAYVQVSTASIPASVSSTNDNADSLSDVILALLSMRARKFYQRTEKKITINGGDTEGFDKTNVECFNCHKLGHFAKECRNSRSQEGRARSYDQGNMSQENSRRTVKVEDTSSKAMVAIDGAGFDWSYMVEVEVPTNMTLMAFSDSEFDLATYKRGLASIEEQLVFYKKNEVMFTDQITVLKRVASFNESDIITLKMQIEKLKKDKEDNLIKIDNYENATKILDKLIGSQIPDNSRKWVGYNAVPPPLTRLFAPPFVDLSNSGLEEFKHPKFEGYGPKANKCVSVDAAGILDLIRQNEYKNETKGLELYKDLTNLELKRSYQLVSELFDPEDGTLEDGTVIHMLVERRYPLSKELLQRMLDFGLEVEEDSTAALDLIRFINLPKIVGFLTHLASWLRVG
ncbi:ribonuclease H-like domain-containing protein [Tanacetum coccineum]